MNLWWWCHCCCCRCARDFRVLIH